MESSRDKRRIIKGFLADDEEKEKMYFCVKCGGECEELQDNTYNMNNQTEYVFGCKECSFVFAVAWGEDITDTFRISQTQTLPTIIERKFIDN